MPAESTSCLSILEVNAWDANATNVAWSGIGAYATGSFYDDATKDPSQAIDFLMGDPWQSASRRALMKQATAPSC